MRREHTTPQERKPNFFSHLYSSIIGQLSLHVDSCDWFSSRLLMSPSDLSRAQRKLATPPVMMVVNFIQQNYSNVCKTPFYHSRRSFLDRRLHVWLINYYKKNLVWIASGCLKTLLKKHYGKLWYGSKSQLVIKTTWPIKLSPCNKALPSPKVMSDPREGKMFRRWRKVWGKPDRHVQFASVSGRTVNVRQICVIYASRKIAKAVSVKNVNTIRAPADVQPVMKKLVSVTNLQKIL